MSVNIRMIEADQTLEIRHLVLWPYKSLDFVKVPEDDHAIHFGLFWEEQLVSVISLFPEAERIRFRKFATLPAFQNRGLGGQLLSFVLTYVRDRQYKSIWCDARSSAIPFYEKLGFSKFSDPFFKEKIEYYKISKNL